MALESTTSLAWQSKVIDKTHMRDHLLCDSSNKWADPHIVNLQGFKGTVSCFKGQIQTPLDDVGSNIKILPTTLVLEIN